MPPHFEIYPPLRVRAAGYGRIGTIRTVAENISSGAKTITPEGMPLASRLGNYIVD